MGALVPRGYGTGESCPEEFEDEDRRGALDAGFDRHLTKPVDPAILDNRLRVEPERSARGRAESRRPRRACHGSALPPLISSDGHLEVRPERWTPRMPAKYRDHAPRTIKLPDGGDAILVEGQPPYPAPFLDLRAGGTTRRGSPSA